MKASELMIGDFVTFRDCLEEDRIIPIRITALRDCDNHFLAKIEGDDISDELEFDEEIVGVPLTPEILEKNGWEERKEYEPFIYYLLKGKDYSISLSKEWDSTTKTIYWSLSIGNHITDASFSVDYIHQLQHALRLCGIEKEIVL